MRLGCLCFACVLDGLALSVGSSCTLPQNFAVDALCAMFQGHASPAHVQSLNLLFSFFFFFFPFFFSSAICECLNCECLASGLHATGPHCGLHDPAGHPAAHRPLDVARRASLGRVCRPRRDPPFLRDIFDRTTSSGVLTRRTCAAL